MGVISVLDSNRSEIGQQSEEYVQVSNEAPTNMSISDCTNKMFGTNWWSLERDEVCGLMYMTIGEKNNNLDDYFKSNDQEDVYGPVVSLADGGSNTIKVMFEHKHLIVAWDSFRMSTLYTNTYFKYITTIGDFIDQFYKSRVEPEDEDDLGEKQTLDNDETPSRNSIEDTNYVISSTMDSDIDKCNKGKFSVNQKMLKEPIEERRVRKLDQKHVSNITRSILENVELSLRMASPLVGLVDTAQCPTEEDFDLSRVSEYFIEIIDGNHSYHAQQEAFRLCGSEILKCRECIVYAGLTNEQCKRVGIKRNKDTANCLPMSDRDFVILTRRAIQSCYPDGEYPGKDQKSRDFWKRTYTTLGFKFEKRTRDSKRPIETLAKLTEKEFSVILEFFYQRPNIRASAITKDLQGIKEQQKRMDLLQTFLINKNAFREAAIKAKDKTVSVEIKDGVFYINQGRKRIEAVEMMFSNEGKTFPLTPTQAAGMVSRETSKNSEKMVESDSPDKTEKRAAKRMRIHAPLQNEPMSRALNTKQPINQQTKQTIHKCTIVEVPVDVSKPNKEVLEVPVDVSEPNKENQGLSTSVLYPQRQ